MLIKNYTIYNQITNLLIIIIITKYFADIPFPTCVSTFVLRTDFHKGNRITTHRFHDKKLFYKPIYKYGIRTDNVTSTNGVIKPKLADFAYNSFWIKRVAFDINKRKRYKRNSVWKDLTVFPENGNIKKNLTITKTKQSDSPFSNKSSKKKNENILENLSAEGMQNETLCQTNKLTNKILGQEMLSKTKCFLELHSDIDCKNENKQIISLKVKILCNESLTISSISNISSSLHKNYIKELKIESQRSFTHIGKNDFLQYSHLMIISIRNTSLKTIEDSSFGLLYRLSILDLTNNNIVTLSWKILDPQIYGRHDDKLHVLLDGNPLSRVDCGTQWAIERLDGPDVDIWLPLKDHENSLEELNQTKSDLWLENPRVHSRMEIDYEKMFEDERDLKFTDNSWCRFEIELKLKECYICLPQMTISSISEDEVKITCLAIGNPTPQIQWDLEIPSFFNISKSISEGDQTYSSIVFRKENEKKEVTKADETRATFATCLASNDRGWSSVSLCDLEAIYNLKLKLIKKVSNVHIELIMKSELVRLTPELWEWSFSPCVAEGVLFKSNLTFTVLQYNGKDFLKGKLHYTKTDISGLLPGWYKIEILTLCGGAEYMVQYYEGTPNQDPKEDCPQVHHFQTLSVFVSRHLQGNISSQGIKHLGVSDEGQGTELILETNSTEIKNESLASFNKDKTIFWVLPVVITGIVIIVIVLFCLLALMVMIRWKDKRLLLSQAQRGYESPFKMIFLDKDYEARRVASDFTQHEMQLISQDRLVENPEYISNSEIEECYIKQTNAISRYNLKFVSELGEGAFGRVFLGVMEDHNGISLKVAVKTLKSLGSECQAELKREVEMLSKLKHEQIINFYGVCEDKETVMMIFEYMEHGDLNNFLRLHNEEAGLSNAEMQNKEPLNVMDCLQIALQIASGMEYLASQHYVHRDLATRNCLVTNNLKIKIGDFGMSRDVYTSDYYQIGGRALLPIRWMPPESILYRRFTIESDIWSFGVVLWEIFTGGKQPWYGYTNQEVITQITAGKMLPCPEKCPPDMYSLMTLCWAKSPQERMSMDKLHKEIKALTTLQPHVID